MRLLIFRHQSCMYITEFFYKLTLLTKCICSRVPFLVKFSCSCFSHILVTGKVQEQPGKFWNIGALKCTVKVVENTYEQVYY